MKIDPRKDLYKLLRVSPAATDEEIKRAYRRLARRFHPDSNRPEASAARFREVKDAYQILSDPDQRHAYDKQRADLGLGPEVVLQWNILTSREKLPPIPEEQVLYVLIEIYPTEEFETQSLPLNLGLVIDRSTSMDGERLGSVKGACHRIVDELEEGSIISIVSFSDRAEVVVPSHRLGEDRSRAHAGVSSIWASGGTEILQGLKAGLEEVRRYHRRDVVSHLLLLTDGRTYGDEEKCLAEARRAGLDHIGISALGIGEDWNDVFLDALARQTGGISTYISYPSQITGVLEEQVRGLGRLIAQNIRLIPRFGENAWLEAAFRAAPHFEELLPEQGMLNVGMLRGGGTVLCLLEIIVDEIPLGHYRLLQLELRADLPTMEREERLVFDLEVDVVKDPPEESVPAAIVNTLGRLSIFRMQQQAWDVLESGNQKEAHRQLERVATRLLDMGEEDLAHRVLLEAGRVAQGGQVSDKGYKTIKYGTRSLGLR